MTQTLAPAPVLPKGWHIQRNPKPIPLRNDDWDFWHDDYDGPGDIRCGTASSPEDAIAQIIEIQLTLTEEPHPC